MRMYVKVMAAVIACILLSGEALSAFATTPATENLSWFKKKKKKPEEKEEKSKSDYEKLVEDSKTTKGMFAVHQKKNDYYFEIPTSLLGRDLLVVNKLQRVPAELNDAGVNRGVNYENQMVCMEWDKATGKLMLRQQRPLPLAPQTDAIFRSVKDNFISPLIAAFKIEAVNADSTALVIKVNDIYDGTETSINNVFTNINLGTSAIKNLSRILSIKSFSNNVVATSELTTRVTEGTTTVYVTVEVSSSILLLPEKPMMGRFDNQKVGYFTNPLLSFSDAQQRTDKTQYITRWRMEPKPEDREAYLKGQMVEPAKPIVFYIDNSTPYQWRSYIKKGIEDWQIAFEKAGFKNDEKLSGKRKWKIPGIVCLIGNIALIAFYSVVAGWIIYYFVKFLTGQNADLGFEKMITTPSVNVGYLLITVVITFVILSFRLQGGLERITKYMMSALLVLMLVLAIHSFTLSGAKDGLAFYLIPDLSKISGTMIVKAMNQAFFTLSVGMGGMAIFGSYIGKERSLLGESVNIIVLDTFVAVVAGMIMFPACDTYNLEVTAGPDRKSTRLNSSHVALSRMPSSA